jgi:hypothetical protein
LKAAESPHDCGRHDREDGDANHIGEDETIPIGWVEERVGHPAVRGSADEYDDDPDRWVDEGDPEPLPGERGAVAEDGPVHDRVDGQDDVDDVVRPGESDATFLSGEQGVVDRADEDHVGSCAAADVE